MKKIMRVLILVLLLTMVLPLGAASAEEGVYAGYFVQDAESGTVVDNGDGTYTLTLAGVAEDVNWLFTSPESGFGYINVGQLALDWAANPDGLEAEAILEVGDMVAELVVGAPVYSLEEATISYVVTPVVLEGEKDAPEIAEEFEAATLYIVADNAFITGLQAGSDAGGARPLRCTKVYYTKVGWVDECTWVPAS